MRHPEYGHRILATSDRLKMAAEIALNHHERWDGTGYPNGREGDEIPLAARIVTLVDIYDALRSRRPYKRPFTHEEAVQILRDGDERINPAIHFDPRIHQLFVNNHEAFDRIWRGPDDR